jgi:excinuclease UvrABC nuclease subunit
MDRIIKEYKAILKKMLDAPKAPFDTVLASSLPRSGGVYQIIDREMNVTIYVGQSANLYNRIYGNHLMGNRAASTLKRKLINSKFEDETMVKDYLIRCCLVQWIEIDDTNERTWFEHFAIALLKPKYNN